MLTMAPSAQAVWHFAFIFDNTASSGDTPIIDLEVEFRFKDSVAGLTDWLDAEGLVENDRYQFNYDPEGVILW